MKLFTKIFIISIVTATLAGCNSEPSESDIQKAIQTKLDDANARASKMMDRYGVNTDGMLTKLNSIRKISCDESNSSKQYSCKVELDITAPLVGRNKSVTTVSVINDSGKWLVVE